MTSTIRTYEDLLDEKQRLQTLLHNQRQIIREDIDEIRVEIEDGEALAFVEFEDGTVKRVRIDSDDEDEIIEALAEELDEDTEDIEDLAHKTIGVEHVGI